MLESQKDELPQCSYDPETWFSVYKPDVKVAKSFCKKCPLQEACFEMGMTPLYPNLLFLPVGTWGGYTLSERKALQRLRRKAAAA